MRTVHAWLSLLAVVLVLLSSSRAHAYPWMIRHDYFGCGTCHVDPSGGGLLTRYGRAQGYLLLAMPYGRGTVANDAPSGDVTSFDSFDGSEPSAPRASSSRQEPSEPDTDPLWGLVKTPSWLLIEGSYRHMTIYKATPFVGGFRFGDIKTFPMQMDAYGQIQFDWFRAQASLGVVELPAGSPFARRAEVTTNQGDGFNLISRTHWVAADLSSTLVLRAGRLEMPFGVRIPEHVMWVRDVTRTDRESSQQHGVALAYTGERLRAEVLAILGNYQLHPDRFRERGYAGYAEVHATDWVYAGVSSLVTHAQNDVLSLEPDMTRQAHGLFTRVAPVQQFVVLAEGDALFRSHHDFGYVGFLQLDFEPLQGLHFMSTGEVLDAGYGAMGIPVLREPEFGRPGFGTWLTVDWFFLPQCEARFDAVARQKTDPLSPYTLLAQLHVYL